MHTFWHNLRYIFQSRYFSILLTPLGHNFSTRCNWTKAILAFKFCKVFWFRFCNFSSAASLQLQLILCFGLSAFPIIDLIPLWPFPFSLMLIWNFGYHSSSAFIWFCTLRIRGSIPAQHAGLPASIPYLRTEWAWIFLRKVTKDNWNALTSSASIRVGQLWFMCTWMRERVLFALLADLFPWMVTTCHHDRWSKCRKREMVDSMACCSSGGARIKIYLWRRREAVKGREPRRQPRATNQRAMATCTSIFGSSASGKWLRSGSERFVGC